MRERGGGELWRRGEGVELGGAERSRGQTWAPPKMLQRRREAVFHSAAAAYRRLEPIFWQHNHCTTD